MNAIPHAFAPVHRDIIRKAIADYREKAQRGKELAEVALVNYKAATVARYRKRRITFTRWSKLTDKQILDRHWARHTDWTAIDLMDKINGWSKAGKSRFICEIESLCKNSETDDIWVSTETVRLLEL